MNWYLSVLKQYAVFSGRARRKEYWMFFLSNLIIGFVLGFLEGLVGGRGIVGILYCLAVLIPGIAVSVRRLHDTGRSGWWLLIAFVPIIGAIIVLVFMAQDGQPSANRYGASPKFLPGPARETSVAQGPSWLTVKRVGLAGVLLVCVALALGALYWKPVVSPWSNKMPRAVGPQQAAAPSAPQNSKAAPQIQAKNPQAVAAPEVVGAVKKPQGVEVVRRAKVQPAKGPARTARQIVAPPPALRDADQDEPLLKDPLAYVTRGVKHIKAGNYRLAIKNFDRAIELDGELAMAYYDRGLALQLLKEMDRAIPDYRRAAELGLTEAKDRLQWDDITP
jgi:uncharacterized membrane protein YhaH (DUF805 family)